MPPTQASSVRLDDHLQLRAAGPAAARGIFTWRRVRRAEKKRSVTQLGGLVEWLGGCVGCFFFVWWNRPKAQSKCGVLRLEGFSD